MSRPPVDRTPAARAGSRWGQARRWLAPITPALVVGLVIRVTLAPYTAWPHDNEAWFTSAVAGQQHVGLYARSQFPYPPVWGLLLQGLGQVLGHLGLSPAGLGASDATFTVFNHATNSYSGVIASPWFNLAFKSLLFAFDVGAGLLLYGFIRELTGRTDRARLAFAVWFLSPFVIFEGAIFGAFDVLVAFFILAAIVLVHGRRHLLAGVALGLGILTKVSPVFLLPLLTVVVARPRREGWRIRMQLWDVSLFGAGILAAVVLAGGPIFLAGEGGAAVHASLARTQTGIVVGGVNLFGLGSLKLMSWLPSWAFRHGSVVGSLTNLAALAAIVAGMVLGLRWSRRDRAYGLLGGATLTLGGILLTEPITQPQYLLWLFPVLLAVCVVKGIGRWQLAGLTVAPVIYVGSLLGPYAMLAPLAKFTGLISESSVSAHGLSWFDRSTGLWGVDFGSDFRSIATIVGIVALLSLLVVVVRRAPRPLPACRIDAPLPRPRSIGAALLVMVAVVATVGATIVAFQPGPLSEGSPALNVVGATVHGAAADLRLAVRPGPGQTTVRVVAIPVSTVSADRTIKVVVDSRYPGPDSDLRTVQGVFDHLSAELRIRGDHRKIDKIDVGRLEAVLADTAAAPGLIVVMTAGVMPSDVFSRNADLVTPWLRAGGTLVWSGDAIGYYSEGPTQTFVPDSPESLHDSGPQQILGPGVVDPGKQTGRTAPRPTHAALALGLQDNATGVGVNLGAVQARGGRAIGFVSNGGLSSQTEIPVGRGGVLVLSGDTYDEETIAHDLWLILMSHVTDGIGQIAFEDLPARATQGRPLEWHTPTIGASRRLLIEVFDPSEDGVVFMRRIVTLS